MKPILGGDVLEITDDGCALRDEMALVYVVCSHAMRHSEGHDRVPAIDLRDEGLEVREGMFIVESRKTIPAYYTVQLFLSFAYRSRAVQHRACIAGAISG